MALNFSHGEVPSPALSRAQTKGPHCLKAEYPPSEFQHPLLIFFAAPTLTLCPAPLVNQPLLTAPCQVLSPPPGRHCPIEAPGPGEDVSFHISDGSACL